MAEQEKLFPDDVGTEGSMPAEGARRKYRREIGRRNDASMKWRRRSSDFEAGYRATDPVGFGGLDDPYPDRPSNEVSRDIVPMASEAAQSSYWSENIHPGSELGRNRAAMASMDADVPPGPLKWPREYSTEFVEPSSLSTVQFEGVDSRPVDRMRGANAQVPPINVEEHAGEMVVTDGNHRVAAALADGALFTEAEVARPRMGPHRVVSDEWGSRGYEQR